MINRFSLYIDLYTPPESYGPILAIFEQERDRCEPITRVLKHLKLPVCTYDLLIIDANYLPMDDALIKQLQSHYTHIIVLNTGTSPYYYDFLFDHGITLWLKKGYLSVELIALIHNYLKERTLAFEKNIWDKMIDSAGNSIVITDKRGNIQFANPYFEKVSGYTSEEFIAKSPNVIKSGFHDDAFYKNLWTQIKSGNIWEGIFVNESKSKKRFYEEATITPIHNSHGEIERYLKIGKNITRERLLLDELSKEVQLARKVVDALLPSHYKDPFVEMRHQVKHYNEIGGDFIFFDKTSRTQYHLAFIDVAGHGISSALVAITVTQMFRDFIKFSSLETAVNAINRFLCAFNDDQDDRAQYVAGTFMQLDMSARTAKLINAGHTDTLALKTTGDVERFPSNNLLMGVIHGTQYELVTISLQDKKHFMFFTDGLYEKQGLEYGEALQKIESLMQHTTPKKTIEVIMNAFHPNDAVDDDVSLCSIIL